MFDEEMIARARDTLDAARRAGAMIATAESCTGGLVAATLTAVAGSSDAVEGGYVTYSNAAKSRLGVDPALIAAHGAVSAQVAKSLAEAARDNAAGDTPVIAVSVTGVAGPGGGSADKPVGLVHFAAADGRGTVHREERFGEVGRDEVRRKSVLVALDLVRARLDDSSGSA
jgi:nicotinamide-nucleotide amidase